MKIIDLSKAGNGSFHRKWPIWYEAVWMIINYFFISNPLQISSKIRIFFLKLFGAKIGENVIIRPRTRIRFPWNLEIGNNTWIGEGVWISNKGKMTIGNNVVISQDSFLTTGSHDIYKTMDVIIKPVYISDGVWITSKCIILQGVTIGMNTVITPGSVVNKTLPAASIYGGNPVKYIKQREILE
ncbi:WcaF family extracellular polysaccharide biosynthesis acetyltransferase [Fictibacillus sp. KIGAM418]|uniref:WcaF family extracellular polysaccharide biosynthesis acetyltransferase n=1 Tax=Fictibacillus marinisediminis TaxID=2878389 RepID=A0A9X1XF76_9BACL|nr:WcaF family extracellular polysaccharide biosynthesis acetyltransferase [Fictibacillus marinisediminis]MCK6259021.1 WcaF family extracellular polysaccharide biosynthesis acetyltransferase [Fictibacillus marinisediminis]